MKLNLHLLLLLFPCFLNAQWTNFCEGNTNAFIVKLAEHQDDIYAAGFFTQICGENTAYVGKWNGDEWDTVGDGLPDPVHNLRTINGTLYAAKYELQVDSNWVYYLDESSNTWQKLGGGFYLTTAIEGFSQTPSIYDVIEYNGDIIVCGEFDRAGNEEVHGIARWDGNHWQPMGTGLQNNIQNTAPVIFPHEMLIFENDLIVVGNFAQAGGVNANGVGRWNGTEWQAMGAGFNSTVYGIGIYNDELYVGGDFSQSGDASPLRIAKWDGSNWGDIGIGLDGFVHTIEEIDGQLYALGGFDVMFVGAVGFANVNHIVQFDGENWFGLDGGFNFDAEAIVPYNGGVLVGGGFDLAGGDVAVNSLAIWNGLTDLPVIFNRQSSIQVSPNPSTGAITISSEAIGTKEVFISIYNMAGQRVYLSEMFQKFLDLSHLPKGIYYLEVMMDGALRGQQFVLR
ncbi:MAG: T9SS type A sorting domain-containing protein [Saprospiraceae bacterium]|nr:T9SS type A sorting domain-containing protein [Saprospiraceae bacterium]